MLGLFKLIAAAALALVLWLAISGPLIVPFASPQEPPRPPEPIPALASATGAPTAPDIAKLNDTIAKLTAAVDKLNQQLAARPGCKAEREFVAPKLRHPAQTRNGCASDMEAVKLARPDVLVVSVLAGDSRCRVGLDTDPFEHEALT